MPIEPDPDYFATPERTDCQQRLIHWLANAPDALYLRAPSGAGKTRFAEHLAAGLAAQRCIVWLQAGDFASVHQLIADQLGNQAAPGDWHALLQAEPTLLLIADNADALSGTEVAQLLEACVAGAGLLLLGEGGLAEAAESPSPGVRFVDLPPFTEDQSLSFLAVKGAVQLALLGDQGGRKLHRAARGLPGYLLEAMAGIQPAPAAISPPRDAGISRNWYLAGAALLLLLLASLLFQGQINQPATSQPMTAAALPLPPDSPAPPHTAPASAGMSEPPLSVPDAGADAVPATTAATATVKPAPGRAAVIPQPAQMTESARMPVASVPDAVLDAANRASEQPLAVVPAPAAVSQPTHPGRPAAAADAGQSVAPAQPAAASKPSASSVSAGAVTQADQGGVSWLKQQAPGHYTLQLVAGRQRQPVVQFAKQHKLSGPYAVFERQRDGQPWYSLVSGSYPSRQAAVRAQERLPDRLRKAAWPRTFGAIFQQMAD